MADVGRVLPGLSATASRVTRALLYTFVQAHAASYRTATIPALRDRNAFDRAGIGGTRIVGHPASDVHRGMNARPQYASATNRSSYDCGRCDAIGRSRCTGTPFATRNGRWSVAERCSGA